MAWQEISRPGLSEWNERLLRERSASIRQYPFYNEALRGSGGLWVSIPGPFAALIARGRRWTTTPRYLIHRSANGTICFACVVSIGVPGLRFGCILDGPVAMESRETEPSTIHDLVTWARRNGFVALRVTHSSEEYLQRFAAITHSDRTDGAPFYPYPESELYVGLSSDDAAMLASFQAVARRNIRQARDAGFVITVDHEPGALRKAWPAFQARAAQKGISYRELETYSRIMHDAAPYRAAHLYTAWRGELPIAAILILRDYSTAHYFLGTIDTVALGDTPSPACFLHWTAMQRAVEMGCIFYNLGTRSGSVYTFKAKFRPIEHDRPKPLTIVVKSKLYSLWHRMLPVVSKVVR